MYDEVHDPAGTAGDSAAGRGEEPATRPAPVVVRRNAAVSALIGGTASAVAIAYLWRASESGAPLDWVLCGLMTLIAGVYLAGLLDARTPLVVADELGVRIRLGQQWRGLPWDAVAGVEVLPRTGPLRDGRLVFRPHSVERALDGLEPRGRRIAALNQRMYGAALAVPLGLTTRTALQADALAAALRALAAERPEVTVVRPDPVESAEPAGDATDATVEHDEAIETDDRPDPVEPGADDSAGAPARRTPRSLVGGLGSIVSRVAKRARTERTGGAAVDEPAPMVPAAFAAPLRETRPGLRAQVTRDLPATTLGATALHQQAVEMRASATGLPERRELRRPGSVDLVFEAPGEGIAPVRPISTLGEPVEPLVLDDLGTEPAADPVIGPELAAARTRVGLSIDELADRTRIRPHVIESIEVDDFTPCGGDFYARGHLRTLARVLGQDPAPLLERFDNRYATAPINARRVFEAELATGMTGSMRSTVGGPNWGLLIGVVLSLVLVWGVVRFFAAEPAPVIHSPAPVLNGSAGVDREFDGLAAPNTAPKPLRITLVAAEAGSRVVVRDGEGRIVYAGRLVLGERKKLEIVPPVKIRARNAGAVEVRVRGKDRGTVGQQLGEPGRRTIRR
jgi:hypothetical protein